MTTRLAVPSSSKITPAKLAKMLDRLRMHGWERAAFLIEHAFVDNQAEESFITMPVEVQFHEAPHSTTLGAPTLRGSDVEWAQQFRPDRKGQTDG